MLMPNPEFTLRQKRTYLPLLIEGVEINEGCGASIDELVTASLEDESAQKDTIRAFLALNNVQKRHLTKVDECINSFGVDILLGVLEEITAPQRGKRTGSAVEEPPASSEGPEEEKKNEEKVWNKYRLVVRALLLVNTKYPDRLDQIKGIVGDVLRERVWEAEQHWKGVKVFLKNNAEKVGSLLELLPDPVRTALFSEHAQLKDTYEKQITDKSKDEEIRQKPK